MATTILSAASNQILEQSTHVRKSARFEMRLYRAVLVVLDLVLTIAAFEFSYWLRFSAGIPFFQDSIVPQIPAYERWMLAAIPFWVAIFAFMGLYRPQNLLGGTREYARVFNAATLSIFMMIAVGFLFPDDLVFARGWVFLVWVTDFVFIATGRFAARRMVYALRKQGRFQNPAVIASGNAEARMLTEQFFQNKTSGLRIIGYLEEAPNQSLQGLAPWLGTLENLETIVTRYGIVDIIIPSSAFTQQQIVALFRQYGTMKDVNLRLSSGLYEIITTGMAVQEVGMVPLVTVHKVRMTGWSRVLKLLLDYAITIPAVVLSLPLFALIALAIRMDSPGPVIYRRRVMGVNGRQFDAFKFRTMRLNADDLIENNPELKREYEASFKIRNDPRVTRVGSLLRKTSMDELPQLWNVLRNEMSLVGPRMISPAELGKYDQWDLNLLTVKPGLTGLWQVRGRSDVSYEERIRMDMYYIRNWNIWLDLQLLMQTIPAVLSRRGAY